MPLRAHVKLHYTVGNRRSGGEGHAAPAGDLVQIAAFCKHIGGLLRLDLADSGYIVHLGIEVQCAPPPQPFSGLRGSALCCDR